MLAQLVQLLETPFVNLINYASLVTTNAARHRFVAGKSKLLLEFGLRRAQVTKFSRNNVYCWQTWKRLPFSVFIGGIYYSKCRGLMVQ